MVIASIDIQNGKVVQLKQGEELVLQRGNEGELAAEFDRYGEIAVIDLDAAMGKGSNIEMIKPLLRKAECRVGGGIRSAQQAKELVSLGANKIIIGSGAFCNRKKTGKDDGEFEVNTPFLEEISGKIGRQRLIIAVDARTGEVVVNGWKTLTGLKLIEAAKAVVPYAGEILFTCVEREGTMTGIDLAQVRRLREAVSCQITVAGGISAISEIEEISALGCDIQLGMALYTGKINLAGAFIASLNWKKGREWGTGRLINGQSGLSEGADNEQKNQISDPRCLLPVIVQSPDGQVLMTGFTDAEALGETFKRGNVCFYSRTRNKLWMKGENSGNVLKLEKIRADCDRDALLATAAPAGPVCHTGMWSCFTAERKYTLDFLHDIVTERFRNPAPGSYTATLDDDLTREKIMEEAQELCEAETREQIIWEAADLLYFITVLTSRGGITVREIFDELDRRHKK